MQPFVTALGGLVALATPCLALDPSAGSSLRSDPAVRVDELGRRAVALAGAVGEPQPPAALVAADWQALGPFGGDIEDVQASPADANLVLAALAPSSGGGGGLYRSTDGGATWSKVATLDGKSCYDVAFAPDGTAYVGTIDGVWKSTNAGASFTALNLGIGLNDQVFEVHVDPTNTQNVWCGVADALGNQPVNVMQSTNAGASWTNRTPPLASPMSCTGIAVDPANNQKVYACFGGGFGGGQVWVSTNGGLGWVNRSAGLPANPMKDILHDGSRVLLAGGQLFGSQAVGLYATIDDGVTWTPLHNGTWPLFVIHDVSVDPNDANTIVVGSAGQGVFRSTDGGASWSFGVGGTGSLSVNAVVFSPGSSTTLYTGSASAAVWKSVDAAASFAPSSVGIGALDVYSIASNPLNASEIAIAFQGLNNGGVWTSLDGGQSWSLEALPGTRYSCVRFAPNGTLYAISSGPTTVGVEGLYARSGATWTAIGPFVGSLFESDLGSIAFSVNDANLIWAAGADFGVAGSEATVWKTTVGGGPGNWTKTYEGPVISEFVEDLIVCDPAGDTTLLAAFVDFGAPQTGGMLRSTDGGGSFLPSGSGLPATVQGMALAAATNSTTTFYVANRANAQNAVYRSDDQGVTWTGTGFVGTAVGVVTDPQDVNVLYIGQQNATKVQASTDGGATFAPYNAGLVGVGTVRELRASGGSGSSLLLAATTGSYRTSIVSSFVPFCAGDGTSLTACPCGNTGQPGSGCDNSAATGGAALTASGDVAPDTVVLTSAGELATVLSIVLQGDQTLLTPAIFGDGVRCVAGNLKRLYVKNAVGGVVTAPDFGAGDPSITARSAALGDPISPGSFRFYQVYYRDPNLGFCPNPPGNSWNVSSAISVAW